MFRLRSHTSHPPGSFQFLQPELGMEKPLVGSFNFVCEQLQITRMANPFLCERHGWSTELRDIEIEVDHYNAARCIAAGWLDFVLPDAASGPTPTYTPPPEKKKRVPVVAGVKRVAAGVALLLDWLGSGGKAVDPALAEKRAGICADCPQNGADDWKTYFTQPIADKIRTQLEIKADLQLRTTYDDRLRVCSACDCPLKLKVHTPMEHILAHTSEDTKTRLDPRCWILKGT